MFVGSVARAQMPYIGQGALREVAEVCTEDGVLTAIGASFPAERHGFRKVSDGFVHEFADPVCGNMALAGESGRRLRQLIQPEHADRGALRLEDFNQALSVAIMNAFGVRLGIRVPWFAGLDQVLRVA